MNSISPFVLIALDNNEKRIKEFIEYVTRYNEKLRIARELDVDAAQKILINEFPQYRHSRFFILALLHKYRCHRNYKREISKAWLGCLGSG